MTKSDAAKLVAMLLQAYPGAQCGPATSAMYERMLADLDVNAVTAAIERHVKTSRFFPTIAEIREMAVEVQHGPRRMGAEAWGDVVDAIRHVGAYRPAPAWGDPHAGECVRMLGWVNLCRSDNPTADRARFIELYDGLAQREHRERAASNGLTLPPGGATRRLCAARPHGEGRNENASAGQLDALLGKIGKVMP